MTSKLVEFYSELQGRPDSKIVLDMETRQPSIPYSYIKRLVNHILEDAMKDELNAIISELEELVIEAKQVKLHLASLSNEDISKKDVDDDS